MSKQFKINQKGFTIIEVMIVLAIAALILLAVFLAVPALQRNSRNTQRKNDISNVLAAVTEFESNNNGAVPTIACGSSGSFSVSTGACGSQTGTPASFKMGFYTAPPTIQTTAVSTVITTDTLTIATGNKCDTTTVGKTTTTGAAARSIAAVYNIETGSGLSPACQES